MAWLLLAGMVVCFVIGVPIAVALGAAVLLTVATGDVFGLEVVPQQIFNAMNSFPLMAIPFFVLAGFLMQAGGMSERLVALAEALVGHLSGGLAMVVVVTSLFFSAISGSGAATTAAVGAIMIPAMVAASYGARYAGAVQASSGALGVILPPSIPLIIYAIAANESVGDMFIAGVLPGLLVAMSLLGATYLVARRRGFSGGTRSEPREVLRAFNRAILALAMPMLVLGGIYGGVVTPTEAAVIAVVYSLFVGLFVYRQIRPSDLVAVFTKAATTTAVVMLVIGTAGLFGFLLTRLGVPGDIADFFDAADLGPILFLLVANVVLLLVGMFIEAAAAILILVPILLPVATELGVDPVHFGVIVVVNLAIGLFTPPAGINLFVAAQISQVSIARLSLGVLPFVGLLFANALLITYVPALSTWLPGVLSGGE